VSYLGSAVRSVCWTRSASRCGDRTTVVRLKRLCCSAASTGGHTADAAGSSPPSRCAAYLELHIEQGPRLMAEGLPAAVVTGSGAVSACAMHVAWGNTGTQGALPRALRA